MDYAAAVASARRHGVGDLLHRTARRYPGKLAVVAGDLRATYAEFDTAVNRAAQALTDRGLRPGDRLALLSHNCWQFAVLAFATAKLGVVLVPVNFMLGADEIAFILRPLGRARDRRRGRAGPDGGEGAGGGRGGARDPRLDRTVAARRRPRAGRTSTAGGARGSRRGPGRRWWATTTRCG